jgi:hypothetical protein
VTVVWAVTAVVPVADELIVVVHVPPLVTQPAGGLGVETAPSESTLVKVTAVPFGARTSPSPGSTQTVAVKVCESPTSFVSSGVIAIRASTHVFSAGSELAPVPSVLRESARPLTVTVVWAVTSVVPVVVELIVVVQLPAVVEQPVGGFGVE